MPHISGLLAFKNMITILLIVFLSIVQAQDVYGCTDVDACNYNPEATIDDGNCYYPVIYCFDFDGDGLGEPGTEELYCSGTQLDSWVENCNDPYPNGEVYISLDFLYDQSCGNGPIEVIINYQSDVPIFFIYIEFSNVEISDFSSPFEYSNQFVIYVSSQSIEIGSISDDPIPIGSGELCTIQFTPNDFGYPICLDDIFVFGDGGLSPFTNSGACENLPEYTSDCTLCYGDSAFLDDCEVCVGGETNLIENWAMDCDGVCFGNGYITDFGCCCGDWSYPQVDQYIDWDLDGYCGEMYDTFCCVPDWLAPHLNCTWQDCDDDNVNINPGMAEFCDDLDNDCNDQIDDDCTVLGDVNIDFAVDVLDVVMIVESILGSVTLSSQQFALADAWTDGSIDVLDVVEVIDLILND